MNKTIEPVAVVATGFLLQQNKRVMRQGACSQFTNPVPRTAGWGASVPPLPHDTLMSFSDHVPAGVAPRIALGVARTRIGRLSFFQSAFLRWCAI